MTPRPTQAPLPAPERVQALLTEALQLPALAPRRARLEALVADYARGHQLADTPLIVALVGATGAGKSTLLNALAGLPLAEEGEVRPTSREATVFAPEGVALGALEVAAGRVVHYRPSAVGGWSGQTFVDTPDLNSIAREHQTRTARVLEAADVALVVMHRGSVAEAVQAEFLSGFANRRRLLFVLNFADEYGPEARAQLKAQVKRLAHERLELAESEVRVFAISAKEARAGRDVSGEWGALQLALRELGERTVAERVRQGNAAAALEAVCEEARRGLDDTEEALGRVQQALAEGVDSGARVLRDDFAMRLRLAEGYLGQHVRRAAAGQGWGPAALWMRLSLLGAGGMGAAALVARASLPAGVAVAAAGTALDLVRSRTRKVAAREKMLETASGGDVALRAARMSLAPARSAAHAAHLSPESLGLPDAEALSATFQALREEAWRRTEGSAVAEAVTAWWKWARWILMPLINLPLLALLVHVAWKVVRAYLEGPLLPGTYFLNALMLGVVLAVAGGTLASASLVGAVRHAVRAGRQRFEERLAELCAEVLEDAHGALSGPREATRALTHLCHEA